ncbi:LacI family DNA-binding transcriptional regulator [Streptomyces sp. Rer75]|uniref:LacI family DNA-binding transcriptional regulator n=1 Tax=Streptomyces sp. Rer75 TaxID=2750011 RepID=UPI0015CF9831|nr:LacI family DNA-binding transcriptional regulator [Streptomyces sp. Rer75]QLH26369.1 LacI family DNA-binding transcriptional regulator [Streptomyces sp. Rer75]
MDRPEAGDSAPATTGGKPPTIADVARTAGVSPSTVSRALNREHRFYRSPSAARIRDVADTIGYAPNPVASNLRRQQTNTIGVLVPRLTDTVMAMLYEEIATAALKRGYHTLVATTHDDPTREHESGDVLLQRRVDGLILTTARTDGGFCKDLADKGVAHVLALRAHGGSPAAVGDDHLGGYLATRHLTDLGHRHIALVAGPAYASSALGRRAGYEDALREAGLPVDEQVILPSSFSMESGEDAGRHLLDLVPRPTAVFAVNDNTAIGVLSAVQRAGLRIPDDLSVVGYNDIPLAARLPVPLTTVRVPFDAIATTAVDQLIDLITGVPTESRTFAPTLIPRRTTVRAA